MRLVPLAAAALAGVAFTLSAPASASGYGVSAACPAGSQGVVVSHGSSATYVCTTAVHDARRILGSAIHCPDCPDVRLPPR